MGLDKVGHLFQQGYEYLKEYRAAEARGGDDAAGLARAVRLGVSQEQGFYGEMLVGVYSNADLAANYAGLKFYLNLTRPVAFAGRSLPPILVRDAGGGWALNPAAPDQIVAPFVSDHFNEALNVSRYKPQMREAIRARLRGRAGRVVAFYHTSPEQEREREARLATWHGEPYGHCGFRDVFTIADTCFE
jgi:hypothetical protein